MSNAVASAPEKMPLLISSETAAAITGVSRRQVWRLSAAGYMPAPVRVLGRTLWRTADIERWVADGCPACTSK